MKKIFLTMILCSIGLIFAGGTVVTSSFTHPDPRIGVRMMQIYLPEGYTASGPYNYPVIYFFHGAVPYDYTSFPFIFDTLDAMIASHRIEPVVVVKPDIICSPYMVSWATNSILNGNYEDLMNQDIANFIEANYRVVADRKARFLMGHSAGAYAAMRVGLKHNDRFYAVAAHSGMYDLDILATGAIPALCAEYPAGAPYFWVPWGGYLSGLLFAMAGAFTPNLTNPPFFVDLPVDAYANVIAPTMTQWGTNNTINFTPYLSPSIPFKMFFDCGMSDEYGLFPLNYYYDMELSYVGVPHDFQPYAGGHSDMLPARFPISLAVLGLKATVDIQPATLNLKSKGQWMTSYIELSGSYSAADIDPSSIAITKINGFTPTTPLYCNNPSTLGDYDDDGIPDLMVKFDRQTLVNLLNNAGLGNGGSATIFVSGKLTNNIPIHNVKTITVIKNGNGPQSDISVETPASFYLTQNSPNPVVHITKIDYGIPASGNVELSIYNLTGERVTTLTNEYKMTGNYSVIWDGKNNTGMRLAKGIYICVLKSGDYSATRKILVSK